MISAENSMKKRKFEHRYERNASSLSLEDMKTLKQARVCVIGCGGLGGYVIETLGRIGVGNIIAVDGDVFDESNLNRQLLSTEETIGIAKAAAAKKRMEDVNSEITVIAVEEFFCVENAMCIIEGCDLVIDALDSLDARLLLEKTAAEMKIPVIHGAISGWQGQVTICMPGTNTLSLVYGVDTTEDDINNIDMDPDRSVDIDLNTDPGNLPFTAAAVANIEASEAIKLLLGIESELDGQIMMIDLLENEFEMVDIF